MNIDAGNAQGQPALADLQQRFLAVLGRKLSRQAFAGEVAGLIAEATRLEGVAVLVYNRRRQRLRLYATRGLPPDARSALAGEMQEAWGIPLRALRNRRINVIESAHVNPFVPRALVALSPEQLTIACLPVYHEYEPVAVVLLFAGAAEALGDDDLHALHQALGVCGAVLRDPGTRGAAAKDRDELTAEIDASRVPFPTAPGAAVPWSTAPGQAGGLVDVLQAQLADLERDLQQARGDLERGAASVRTLTASRDALARERDRLTSQLTELEQTQQQEGDALRAEVAALEDRLAAVESERVKFQRQAESGRTVVQRSLTKTEAEREQLREQLQAAETRITRLQAETEGLGRDRERLIAQVDTIRQLLEANQAALEQGQVQTAQELELVRGERDSWKDRAGALQTQNADLAERQRTFEHDLRTVQAERAEARDQLASANAALAARDQQAIGTNAALAAERNRQRDDNAALRAQLAERAEQQRALELRLQRETAARSDAAVQLEAKQAALEHAHRQYAEDLATLTAERDRLSAQVTALQSQLAQAADTQRRREDEARSSDAARAAAADALETLRRERDELAAMQSAVHSTLQQAEVARTAADAERDALRAHLDDERSQRLQAEDALRAELHGLRAERDDLASHFSAVQGELAARQAAQQELQDQLDRLVADHGSRARAATEAETAAAALRAEAAEWRARCERAEAERQRAAAALEAAHQQLALAHSAPGEAARAIADELATARTALAEAEQRQAALQSERDSARERAGAIEHTLDTQRADGEALQRRFEAVSAEHADLSRRLAAAEHAAAASGDQLTSETRRATELADRCTRLDQALALGKTRRAELTQELSKAREEIQGLQESIAEAQRSMTASDELAGAEVETARRQHRDTQAALADSERQRAELAAALQQARTEADLLAQQSSDRASLARQAAELGAKVAELEHLRDAARAEADAARSAADEQRQHFTRALDEGERQRQEQVAAAQRERDRLRVEVERLTAEQERRDAERTHAQTAQAADLQELRTLLSAVQRDRDVAVAGRDAQQAETAALLQRLAEERRHLQVQFDQYRQAQAAEQATTAARIIALEGGVADAKRARDEAILERDLAVRQAAVSTPSAYEREQVEALTAALREREQTLAQLEDQRRVLAERLGAVETGGSESLRERRELHRRVDCLTDELESARTQHAEEIDALQRGFAAKLEEERRAALEREARIRESTQLATEQRRAVRGDSMLVIERSGPTATAEPAPAAPKRAPSAAAGGSDEGDVVLLDDGAARDQTRAALKEFGVQPHVAAATSAAVDDIARRRLKSVILNLGGGAPAWLALKEMRERVATRTVPILAYVTTPDLHTGFSFGRADFGVWPLDATRIVERLRTLRPKLRRLLVVSADIEGMGRLREPLAKAGIGASMALDGKQAQDLANSIQPEAAILHLSPGCADVTRALAAFRIGEPSLQLPLLVLVDKSVPREDDFYNKITLELLRRGSFEVSRIGEEFIRVSS